MPSTCFCEALFENTKSYMVRDLSYIGNVSVDRIDRKAHSWIFYDLALSSIVTKRTWFNIILSIFWILFHQDNMIKVVKTSLFPHDSHPFWLCFIIRLVVSTHLKKYQSNWKSSPNFRGENKKYELPPPSFDYVSSLSPLHTIFQVLGRISPMSCHRVRGTLLG